VTRLWRGRPVLVVALVLAMASAAEALILLPTPIQSRLTGPVAWIGGGLGLTVAAVLTAAWWTRSGRLRRAGMWLAAGMWAWISALAVSAQLWASAVLTVPWVVLAAGSAWQEEADKGGGGE